MNKTQGRGEENRYIVWRVSMTDTLKKLPIGKPVTFDVKEACGLSTVRSAKSRLENDGKGNWRLDIHGNGESFTVTRLA